MPPISCERTCRVDHPADGEHAEHAGHGSLPVSASTRTSTKCAPNEAWRELLQIRVVGGVRGRLGAPAGSSPCSARNRRAAATIADPHDDGARGAARHRRVRQCGVPDLPRSGSVHTATRRRRSASASSTCRCRCRGARSHGVPAGFVADGRACCRAQHAGYTARATPVPISHSPSLRAPGRGSRSAQPNRSAPGRRHSTQPAVGPRVAGLGIDVRLVADAQFDRVDAAGDGQLVHRDLAGEHPGHSPGAASRTAPAHRVRRPGAILRRFGAAYIIRDGTAVCSANSLTVEVCSTTSWRSR